MSMKEIAEECIFCEIVEGKIPSPRVYEDDQFICIKDIQPQAKIHLLLIPKKHFRSLAEAFPQQGEQQTALVGKMMEVSAKIAWQEKLLPAGYRTVINTGEGGGQTVGHLHMHLLGGGYLHAHFA